MSQAQSVNREEWYEANAIFWQEGGYGGRTDDEAMVGDEGAEEDGVEGLAFLDRLLAGDANFSNHSKGRTQKAMDVGAGVGRVTKTILLKRYGQVRLVEGDAALSKRSRTYLGKKRCANGRCTFTCAMLQNLQNLPPDEESYDVVWVQWCLQYLTDVDVILAIKNLASSLTEKTGYLIIKENRPYGSARGDRFQMDTPSCSGRYDITRTDNHHRLLFQRAGLVVVLAEEGVETNTYALVDGGTVV